MKTITATELKAKCLNILDHIPPEGIEITKRGHVVARLMPGADSIMRLYGSVPDLVVDKDDDLLSTGVEWDAAQP